MEKKTSIITDEHKKLDPLLQETQLFLEKWDSDAFKNIAKRIDEFRTGTALLSLKKRPSTGDFGEDEKRQRTV